MKMVVCFDRHIPPREIRRSLYVWETIGKAMGILTELTDKPIDIRPTTEMFSIYYGRVPNIEKSTYDLVVPYDPIEFSLKVKYIEGVPILYGLNEPTFLVDGSRLGFDVIAVMFHFMSGYEEYTSNEFDSLDRHEMQNLSITRLKLTKTPVLNVYIDLIRRKIEEKFGTDVGRPLWKSKAPFALALSHDVDVISRFSLTRTYYFFARAKNAGLLLERMKLAAYSLISLVRSPTKYLLRHDELWPFEVICGLEKEHNVRSTFFCLPPRGGASHYLDGSGWYSYNEKLFYGATWVKLKDILQDIYQSGWKIGLHAGLESYRNGDVMKQQKTLLENELNIKLVSVRQHWLRFKVDDTWKVQNTAKFWCDSTYGFNDRIGFRPLYCLPYRPFSLTENRQLNMWELPLTIQDNALFRRDSLEKQSNKTGSELAISLLNEVKKVGGVATLLWHSNTVSRKHYPGWFDAYKDIIEWATDQKAYIGPIEEIIDHWEARDKQIPVVHKFTSVNME